MKICIISMTNLFLCPYIKKYTALLDGNTVDLVCWNRHDIEENTDQYHQVFQYRLAMNEHVKPWVKLNYFFRFQKFCEKILRKNCYDRVIILHNYMAILMRSFLFRYYKNKYLMDIRDYSFESNKLFYALEKNAVKNSGMAVISSDGFRHFLPKHHYVVCHNDPNIPGEIVDRVRSKNQNESLIRISFIGLVRFYDQNIRLMNIFKNDARFVLAFYGQNSERLEQYAKENNICNVEFRGRFEPDETVSLYEKTSIINNYYGNHTPVLDYALSNKLYYAALFHKPILVCEDTYMYDISMKYSFGICLNEKQCTADSIYRAYTDMDRRKLEAGCDCFLQKVETDNQEFIHSFYRFLDWEE